MKKFFLFSSCLFLGLFLVIIFGGKKDQTEIQVIDLTGQAKTPASAENSKTVFPVVGFEERITQKPFGVYITPENSPIKPERFTGYHTGVDVEFEDIEEAVPVFAVCDGEIVFADWVIGYGGTMVLKCDDDSRKLFVLYGHLDQESFTTDQFVIKGQKMAVLGEGFSQETDRERHHLHFGIRKNELDLRGYVQNRNELNSWINPVEFF